MEKFQQHREDAKKYLGIADHLLLVTYPLVKDPKLLLTITENVYKGFENAMNAVLEYDRTFKKINVLPDAFSARFTIFSTECAPRYKLTTAHLKTLKELKDTLNSHKSSPIEFTREDKFVISDDNYKLKTVSLETLKSDIKKGKAFIEEVEPILNKNEGIFRRSA